MLLDLIPNRATILLTRPLYVQDEALWHKSGFNTVAAPLLKVKFLAPILPDLKQYQAIVTTSSIAIKSLSSLTEGRGVPLWCVGKASAAVAVKLGFKKVFTPDTEVQNASTLLKALLHNLAYDKGPILYTAGGFVHLDLSIALKEHGYTVDKLVLYQTMPEPNSWPKIQDFLANPSANGITFYSQRTTSYFKDLLTSNGCVQIRESCYPLCLSTDIATIIQHFFTETAIIASTTEKLIANLKQML